MTAEQYKYFSHQLKLAYIFGVWEMTEVTETSVCQQNHITTRQSFAAVFTIGSYIINTTSKHLYTILALE